MQTTETVKTTYSTGPGGIVNKTVTTNYSTNSYNDTQQIQNISNNFQDTLRLNDTSSILNKPKIPPSTLPKPNLNNWQNQGTLNKTTTQTQYRQQQSTIPAPGQSSFTGSRSAPRR